MSEHERFEHDVAAYALGALEPSEVAPFEQHLAGCARCREELAAMRQAVDALPAGAPSVAAPAELKQRVMATVRTEAAALGAPEKRARAPRRPWIGNRGRRIVPGLALAAAAAVAILIVTLDGGSSTRTYGGTVYAPRASASVRVSGGRARLVFARLPALPAQLIYEMWVTRGANTPVPAGALFDSTTGAVAVPGGVRGVQAVLVTAERRPHGSRAPTRKPLIVVRVA